MELDLVEIRRLSPRELWTLAPIRALIGTLLVVIKSGSGGPFVAMYMRMLVQQSESLREKVRENLNMRIKAWVIQCPDRIAWVRCVIGKAAIRHWRKNRLLDYALSKYFGDWKHKFPDGFAGKTQKEKPIRKPSFIPAFKPAFWHAARPYAWKPFALVKIINVSRFLYGRPARKMDTANKHRWTQPRGIRMLKPIRFTPDELVAEAVMRTEETGAQNKARHLDVEPILLTDQRALSLPCIASPTDPPLDTKPP